MELTTYSNKKNEGESINIEEWQDEGEELSNLLKKRFSFEWGLTAGIGVKGSLTTYESPDSRIVHASYPQHEKIEGNIQGEYKCNLFVILAEDEKNSEIFKLLRDFYEQKGYTHITMEEVACPFSLEIR